MTSIGIAVFPDPAEPCRGTLDVNGRRYPCVLGRGGVIAAADKREGDGKSPLGDYPLRRLFYRADRLSAPVTGLPLRPLTPADGWCDAALDPRYNQAVTHPYPAIAERLWRNDGVYDLIVILGHNDDPPRPGRGSAIFLHVMRDDLKPTEGCVAMARDDLLAVLRDCDRVTRLRLYPRGSADASR